MSTRAPATPTRCSPAATTTATAPGSRQGLHPAPKYWTLVGSVATWAALSGSSTIMVRKNVAEIIQNHVTFELEAIDRMYLNAYVPSLQTGGGFVYFVKTQLGARVPSTMLVAPLSQQFVEAIERFVATEGIDLVTFEKGQRKDELRRSTSPDLRARRACSSSARPKRRPVSSAPRNDATRLGRPTRGSSARRRWSIYYVYLVDKDFGPLFVKFCSYFPYAA